MRQDRPDRLAAKRGRMARQQPWRRFARFERIRATEAAAAASSRLRCNADWSAAKVRFHVQHIWPILLLLPALLLLMPRIFLVSAHHMLFTLFAMGVGFRWLLLLAAKPLPGTPVAELPADPYILPMVTILLPLYHEAKVLPQLVAAIEALDWPKGRLDVKLLLEEDDTDTLERARQMRLPGHWEVFILPDIGPRTKPKALNVGLARAKGAFVTIFDAEDIPHRSQLRAAIQAFADHGDNLVCVQAPLRVHNAGDGWLPAQFAAEYDAHFRVLLPAMQWLGFTFPLGGTSNYFRTGKLKKVGGWDAHNVTEDADLGFRLARMGGKLACITLSTEEEATRTLPAWMGQRSRWIKGFVQTLIVHMRHMEDLSLRQSTGLFLFLGLSLLSSFLHLPVMLFCLVSMILAIGGTVAPPFADLLLGLAGLGSALGLIALGARRAGKPVSLSLLLTAPLYWPLQSLAAMRAFLEMFTRPFHWQKTDHGHAFHSQDEEK